MRPNTTVLAISLFTLTLWMAGCAASRSAAPMRASTAVSLPPLKADYFQRDTSGSISEQHLKKVLAAPVFLEAGARLGVMQVAGGYRPDHELPLTGVPGVLTDALGQSGMFEVATEVSADWPTDGGVSGLRELAARYRSEYLLLYRHRFVDLSFTNDWGWTFPTLIGLFAAPARTIECAGIMEATLFEVKTGTILFTVFARVHGERNVTLWRTDRHRRQLITKLVGEAAAKLAEEVVTKSRLLARARPQGETAVSAVDPVLDQKE